MTESYHRLPNEMAAQLQVSPSTLRRWSNEFADYLSGTAGQPSATSAGQASHRRYTDADLETLLMIKGLLAEGLTYTQVSRRLDALRLRSDFMAASGAAVEGEARRETALSAPIRESGPVAPVVTVLADTLHTVAEGQQLLLGSQQANRDLLTVVLQDNFSLKEENARLRDRMLELERQLAEIQRLENVRRETVDARLSRFEEQLRLRRPAPARAEAKQQKGCLSQLLGPLG
jgi:DNA-binding transcriptional MerR regulator